MASLTDTAQTTRKALKYGVIVIIVLIILKIAWDVTKNVWHIIHPAPPPPPTVAFGKLPKLKFPERDTPQLTYRLETVQGALPTLPDVGRVYFMPKEPPSLLALDREKQKARQMGFTTEPVKTGASTFRWTTTDVPPTTLEIDINNGNFHFRYQYENDQEILVQKNLPIDEQSAKEGKSFLRGLGLLSEDIATGSAEFNYLKFISPNLIPAVSLSEADFVRVNFFRADLHGLRILPPNPKEASISFLFSGDRRRDKRIIEVHYNYFLIDINTSATYPLKPINTAWQELQEGEGYIANLGQNEEEIVIRRIYLAFYDSKEAQHFLQPVYVFEGDQGFYAYVSAIDPKWME